MDLLAENELLCLIIEPFTLLPQFHNCNIRFLFTFALLVIQILSILHVSIWVWSQFENIHVFTSYLYSTTAGRSHYLFRASWRTSLSFNPMIISSLTAVSSTVHCTQLHNAMNVSFSFCKFDWNIIGNFLGWFVIMCHHCYKIISLSTFSCFFCRYCHVIVCLQSTWRTPSQEISDLISWFCFFTYHIKSFKIWFRWWIFRCSLTYFPPFCGSF